MLSKDGQPRQPQRSVQAPLPSYPRSRGGQIQSLTRRAFLSRAALLTGGALSGAAVLQILSTTPAFADPEDHRRRGGRSRGGYGPLRPSRDCPELALPEGFRCRKISVTGAIMSDGNATPPAPDGMAAFRLRNGNIRLIRNHEIRTDAASSRPFGNPALAYDLRGGGGCTSLEIRPRSARDLIRDFVSLNGTTVNCAGGTTPWGSWLSCEETTVGPGQGWVREHGYVFEVPAVAEGPVTAAPLRALGRFVHEAAAVDPESGIVYETEDFDPAGLYRFLPHEPRRLAAGGRLQMLAVRDRPNYDARIGQMPGRRLPVVWVDIDRPDPPEASGDPQAVYRQGAARGGAAFRRLEGAWFSDDSLFVTSTSGGQAGLGQVWEYRPHGHSGGQLRLLFESQSPEALDRPDNICVSPRGGILLCEDGPGQNFLRGLTPDGHIFDFATNLVSDGEFAGATFSPDGETLFVNISNPGMTFAIWGDWEEGAL